MFNSTNLEIVLLLLQNSAHYLHGLVNDNDERVSYLNTFLPLLFDNNNTGILYLMNI